MRRSIFLFALLITAVCASLPAARASGLVGAGRIVYDVHYGSAAVLLGKTEHQWRIDPNQYELRAQVETTGFAALVKSFSYVQRSRGRVQGTDLVPDRLDVTQSGKNDESAEFDWRGGEVVIRRGEGKIRRAPIRRGDQDVLSLWHQARQWQPEQSLELLVATNKAAAPTRVEWLGGEALAVPAGTFQARHFRVKASNGELNVELWISDDERRLPLRIRITERKGDVIDQVAREIHLNNDRSIR